MKCKAVAHYVIEHNMGAGRRAVSEAEAMSSCEAIVAIMPHAKRQFGCLSGHKLQHFGYQHLVTLHLAK